MGDGLRKAGVLWRKTGKKGNTFYSGTLDVNAIREGLTNGETRLFLFPVREKRGRGPDVELFLAPDQRQQQPTESEPVAAGAPSGGFDDDDAIPFGWLLPMIAALGGLVG